MIFNIIILALVVSVSCVPGRRPGALRVEKGKTDSNNEFPFIVLLYLKIIPHITVRDCTGSLIARNWVLTAGHCLRDRDPNILIVRYGDFTARPNETSLNAKVIETFVPSTSNVYYPGSPAGLRDDIGLVLVENIPKKQAKLLALDYKTLSGLPVKFAGFGQTVSSEKRSLKDFMVLFATPLQVGEGIVVPCANFKNLGPVICVAAKCSNSMQTILHGDSGGPLVYDGRIVGVAKVVLGREISLSGGFYPVSIYLQWIQHVMFSNGY